MASTSSSEPIPDQNQELINQFCMVAGSTVEIAKKMLEVCNWDLQMALNMHVDSDVPTNSKNVLTNGDEDVRAPIPQSRAVLLEEDMSFHYGLRGRKRRSHSVFDAFRDFQAEAEMQGRSPTDPEAKENYKKLRTLEDLFRPPLDIMCRGNFESAREFGQTSNKWLMVNLQNSQEFACQVLNRDVWSKPEVKKAIMQNFIFWQVYNDSLDGQRYMQFYKPVDFPYVAILDPMTGEKLCVWHNVNASNIFEYISAFLREHNTPNGSSSNSAPELSLYSLLDQSEEEQLRIALEASKKENLPLNVEDNDSDLETFDSDSESNSAKVPSSNNTHLLSDHSNDMVDIVTVADSNDKESSGDNETWKDFLGGNDDPKSDLVLRLPDGKREQITWPCTTKVKALLLYIKEIGYDPEKYELVTNYPRRNLCKLDLCKSLKEVELFPREMIFVQLKT